MKKVEQHDWLYPLQHGAKESQRMQKTQQSLLLRARDFLRDIRTQRKKMILNQWKRSNFQAKLLASKAVAVLVQRHKVRSTLLTATVME
jgi:hypothetical protein